MSRPLVLLAVAAVAAAGHAAPVPKPGRPQAAGANTSALVKKHKDKLKFSASTDWKEWPADRAFDGDPETSWFSASNDFAGANGKDPWVAVEFPDGVTVSRVTVLGNREPQWLDGYSVLAGRVELLDNDGRVVAKAEAEAKGDALDLDFVLPERVGRVRAVRFVGTKDQTSAGQSQTKCVGIAEVQVE